MRPFQLPIALAFLLSLILILPALYALARQFDGLYGQDPYAYYEYAIGPLRGALGQPALPPPFYWPPGYPLLVALASFLVGARPLAGQVVSLLAGAAVPLFTALLAREVWPLPGRAVVAARGAVAGPLAAGLLIACCGQLWQSSIVVMSDTTGLAAATAGVWALARYGRRWGGGWLALAAGCVAWAVVTRWAYALVALVCVAYVVWVIVRCERDRRRMRWHIAGAAVVAGAILAPVVVPAIEGLRAAAPNAAFAADLQVYRWNPLHAFRREFVTADGRLVYPWPNGLYYASLFARPLYFTPLLALFALPGLWRVVRRPTAPLLLLVGWVAVVLGFHAGAPWQNVRFALACAPPLAILIALGVASLWERGDRRLAVAATGLLALGVAWMLVSNVSLLDRFIDRKEADLAVARAVAAPPDTRVLTFGLTLTLRHYTPYPTHDLSELDPAALAALLADGRPTLLLLDVANIEAQWRGRAPEINYRWLRDTPGLTPIARHGAYTLFRVGGGVGQGAGNVAWRSDARPEMKSPGYDQAPDQAGSGGASGIASAFGSTQAAALIPRYSLLVTRYSPPAP